MTNTATDSKAAGAAQRSAPLAPRTPSAKKTTIEKRDATKRPITAKGSKKKTLRKKATVVKPKRAKTASPRAESKTAKILELIGQAKGATLAEIMKATEWQAHSIRGFLSTAKKRGVKIESTKSEAGDRVYQLVK